MCVINLALKILVGIEIDRSSKVLRLAEGAYERS